MVSWSQVISDTLGAGDEMVQTLICAICLTGNVNAAFPYRLVTYSRSVGSNSRASRPPKAVLEIPPGLDGYPYFVEATYPGNTIRNSMGEEWNPQGQTYVDGCLMCAYHAADAMKKKGLLK